MHYMYNLKVQVMYGCQHIEQLFYYWRHSLCGFDLHERSDWRAMAQNTQQSFSDKTLCAYTASLTYIVI